MAKKTAKNPRVAHCIFCDDIRMEVGNKASYIGVYSGEMQISAAPPVAMPILGLGIWLICDIDDPPDHLGIRVILPDGVELVNTTMAPPPHTENAEGARKKIIGTFLKLSPLPLTVPGYIESWIDTETGPLRAGRLKVTFNGPASTEQKPV